MPLKTMLGDARKSLKEDFLTAEEALSRDDLASLSIAAHSIKGVLQNIGLHDWSDLAQRIEQRHVRAIDDLTGALEEQVVALRKGLAPLIE